MHEGAAGHWNAPCRTKRRAQTHQGHHRERKCCSNVPALIPASAEPHTMQQGKLRRSKKGVGGQSSVQCTPVSASILRAAFCLASSLTSCHFF